MFKRRPQEPEAAKSEGRKAATDDEVRAEEDKLERDRARLVVLRAIKRTGWWWPGED